MENLIKALNIFLKYGNEASPTGCEYDMLYVYYSRETMETEDIEKLELLGFLWDKDLDAFYSYRFMGRHNDRYSKMV